jgi:hypothetical protein
MSGNFSKYSEGDSITLNLGNGLTLDPQDNITIDNSIINNTSIEDNTNF